MKKTLIILTILVVFIVMFAGAWWFLMRGDDGSVPDTTDTGVRSFNPFGMFGGDDAGMTPSTDNTSAPGFSDTPSARASALIKISDAPTAGATAIQVRIGTSTEYSIRYVEKETGHIYDYSITTGQTTRVSNTTIPRVREALFGNFGNTVVFRRIQEEDGETVESFLGKIAAASTSTPSESRLSGTFLPANTLSVAVHPSQHQVFYTVKSEAGSGGFIVSDSGTRAVFSHQFYQWQSSWNAGATIFLTTAPSRTVGGITFSLNPSSGAFARVSSTTPGLTVLPNPDGKILLLGLAGQGGVGIVAYDTSTRQTTPLSIATLPEKCAWENTTALYCAIPSNTTQKLPDEWYQGSVSFIDTLWKINATNGTATYILNPSDTVTEGLDITHLSVSQNGNHIAFINKKDGSLWLVDLSLAVSSTMPADEL